MRLSSLSARNFRGWCEGVLPLDRPLTVLVGENRRGKSSTVNAIEWCLFGREIEKKKSGIAERADWEVERRCPGGASVEVALAIELDGVGRATITRRRKAGAGARDEDELEIALPDGSRRAQAEAESWLREQKLPDWDTWRRACCQHQEMLRGRLTVADDLSHILSSLLGLEEHDRLHRLLKDQQPGKIVARLDEELAELEKVVLHRLAMPSEELFDSERKLAALGLERARLSPALGLEICRTAVERARALAERLGFRAELPACETEASEPDVKKWADGWIAFVRKESKTGERLASAQKRRAKLASELEQLEPSEDRWRKAKESLDADARERGDAASQKKLLGETEKAIEAAEASLRSENRTLALLRDTLEVLRAAPGAEQCPVCDTRVEGLAARLETTVRKGTGERLAALTAERDRARERRGALEKSIRASEKLAAEESETRKAAAARRESLTALVSPGRLDGGADLLPAARAEDEALAAEIAGLEASVSSLDAELDEHRRDQDRLKELARWRAAAKRAQQRADLTSSPEWKTFQEAVDAAAALAADLDALGGMAREAQEERSASREVEVNRSLAEFVALIVGEGAGLDVRVRVKRTPKGLTYDIEDSGGGRAISILNQASLNAISLALLFAQAEDRAKNGLPTMVVLDDPDQSLDDEHRNGLARAIDRVARACPVIVAATPGRLADRLMSHVMLPRRAIRLGRRDVERGVWIESQEDR
ncbi:MAG TPA: AAA family ATPase [Myxococcota bacterium]|nr:AAA family ATPase [Myxococcota bacterium]